jgi:uncharacterized damage-inducible protein DinB
MTDLDELRYPVGRFDQAAEGSRSEQIETLRLLPERLRAAVHRLDEAQLDAPYREGGWTVRQLVHHIADSHMNSYIRVKLALTENAPTISAYDEAAWAKLPDSQLPIDISLVLIDSIHIRLVSVFESMSDSDFQKSFKHPERGAVTLASNLALYAWHSKHHTAHVTRLRERMGW